MGILGVDESNHGRFPEIFVGRFSTNNRDGLKRGSLSKLRGKKNTAVHELDYRFFSLNKDVGKQLGPRYGMIVSIAEFVSTFDDMGLSLEKIVVDGKLTESQLEELEKITYPKTLPTLIHESKADNNYPCVNDADTIANGLYRMFTQNKEISGNILKREIQCDVLTKYAKLIRRIKANQS